MTDGEPMLEFDDLTESVGLMIPAVMPENQGYYFCRGNNTLDTVLSEWVYLKVVDESKCSELCYLK